MDGDAGRFWGKQRRHLTINQPGPQQTAQKMDETAVGGRKGEGREREKRDGASSKPPELVEGDQDRNRINTYWLFLQHVSTC